MRRVLYLYHATNIYSRAALKLYREAASALGMVLLEQAVRSEEEAQATLAQSQKGDVDGILAPLSLAFNLPGEILKAATQHAIPTMFSIHGRFLVEHGGLVSYGADAYASGRKRHVWSRRSAKAPLPQRSPSKSIRGSNSSST